jgi:DNA-directed RNA polymerase specialized sigma24 family protein
MSNASGKEFVLTDYARNLIRIKARQLSRQRNFRHAEEEDLRQELWMAVVNQADKFDPSRASVDTFIDRVVNSAVVMLARERQREKRAEGYLAISIDSTFTSSASKEPIAAQISPDDLYRRTRVVPADPVAVRERKEAVDAALEGMPSELRDTCGRLMKGSIASASREEGISRRQIRKALAAARRFLERSGLDAG